MWKVARFLFTYFLTYLLVYLLACLLICLLGDSGMVTGFIRGQLPQILKIQNRMIFTPTLTNKLDISNTDVFFSVVSFSTCGAAWLRGRWYKRKVCGKLIRARMRDNQIIREKWANWSQPGRTGAKHRSHCIDNIFWIALNLFIPHLKFSTLHWALQFFCFHGSSNQDKSKKNYVDIRK